LYLFIFKEKCDIKNIDADLSIDLIMIGYGSLHRGMLTLATVSWHTLPNEI